MPQPTRPANARTPPPSASRQAYPDIDPRWLLKALAIAVVIALVCGYLTLCFLFSQGQWQLVLHPVRTSSSQSPVAAIGSGSIHFAPDESAVPQLTGWWIPAAPGSRYPQTTLLYLAGADGSVADAAATLSALHAVGMNVFAFDYRGYGQSAATHPSQKNMTEDAESAWRYLQESRKIPPSQIVPFGSGAGTSLAVSLALAHPQTPAVILESTSNVPQVDLFDVIVHDPRARFVPARLLFHEKFPLAGPIASLHSPKLLLSTGSTAAAFNSAIDPKMTVEFNPALGPPAAQAAFAQAITRFLDQTLPPSAVPQLVATPSR